MAFLSKRLLVQIRVSLTSENMIFTVVVAFAFGLMKGMVFACMLKHITNIPEGLRDCVHVWQTCLEYVCMSVTHSPRFVIHLPCKTL